MTPVNSHLYSFTNYKVCSCILFSVFFQNILVKCDKIHGLITILKKSHAEMFTIEEHAVLIKRLLQSIISAKLKQ